MTVEQVRLTTPVRPPARPLRPQATFPPSQRPAPREGAVCLVLPEIAEGEAPLLVRNLRRRESSHAILLARQAGRRELVTLLNGGIRGAVSTDAHDGVGAPSGHHNGPDLTAREVGVLELVADGQSNKQIGDALELSALTVKSHLARISRKLGTGDRAEMVAYALRNQLIG